MSFIYSYYFVREKLCLERLLKCFSYCEFLKNKPIKKLKYVDDKELIISFGDMLSLSQLKIITDLITNATFEEI